MKTRCGLLVALATLTITGFAQNEFARRAGTFSGGSYVGANFSTASIENINFGNANRTGRTDLLAGVMLQYQISRPAAIRGELSYMQYGYNVENTSTAGGVTYTNKEFIKVNYLETSLIFIYQLMTGTFAPYFFGGAFGGPRFCAGGNYESGNQTGDFDIRESTSPFQFGVLGGAGAEYKLDRGFSFFVDARYQLGLNNIYRRPSNVQPASALPEPVIKYRAFNIRGGIIVDL